MPARHRSSLDKPGPLRDVAPHGAVAQLGERVVRNDEVRGSIPLGSTKPPFSAKNARNTLNGKAFRRFDNALSGGGAAVLRRPGRALFY